jgi:hypothetical protein
MMFGFGEPRLAENEEIEHVSYGEKNCPIPTVGCPLDFSVSLEALDWLGGMSIATLPQ